MSTYNKDYAKPCFNIIERVYHESDDLRRLGSAAVELAYLAAGRVELYFEIRLFPWDVAAAIPIVREAGGCFEVMFEEALLLERPMAILAANSKEILKNCGRLYMKNYPSCRIKRRRTSNEHYNNFI